MTSDRSRIMSRLRINFSFLIGGLRFGGRFGDDPFCLRFGNSVLVEAGEERAAKRSDKIRLAWFG